MKKKSPIHKAPWKLKGFGVAVHVMSADDRPIVSFNFIGHELTKSLVVAAPLLLEACKRLIDGCECICELAEYPSEVPCAICQAIAAVEAATGVAK